MFDWSDGTGAIDMKADRSVLDEKSYFKMLGMPVSSKLDWGSYITSVAKSTSRKIRALIHSMKFLSPEVLFISINLPYNHAWNTVVTSLAGAPSFYLELLDKLQKQICRTLGTSLDISL